MEPIVFSLELKRVDEQTSIIIFELGYDEDSKQTLKAKVIKGDLPGFQFDDLTDPILRKKYPNFIRSLVALLSDFCLGEKLDLPYTLRPQFK